MRLLKAWLSIEEGGLVEGTNNFYTIVQNNIGGESDE